MLDPPVDHTPQPIIREPSSPSYYSNSPYYAEPTIPTPPESLLEYRTTPPTETPSSFSDVTTYVTSTTLASSVAADQAVHPIDHVSDVLPVDHVDDVDHIDHIDDVTDVDLPQYDESCAWLFEPIIDIENSDHE